MELSLNEVETTAMKAARGAGHAWGVAEDFGRSARWLASMGLDWATSLLSALDDPDRMDPRISGPVAGLALADALPGEAEGEPAELPGLRQAVWILPPVAAVAAAKGATVRGSLGGWRFAFAGTRMFAASPLSDIAPGPLSVSLARVEAVPADLAALGGSPVMRSTVALNRYRRLEEYVWRTYVPNSEKSRLRGAGSHPSPGETREAG